MIMEILIVGLILVALMVYASTRIKRTAAEAYNPEWIETDEFVIDKPEGFLVVIGGDPQYLFEAYSKEFGGEAAPDFRRATAYITRSESDPAPEDQVLTDRSEKVAGRTYRVIEAERLNKGVEFSVFTKSATNDGGPLRLEIIALKETTDEMLRDIESMLHSFEVR